MLGPQPVGTGVGEDGCWCFPRRLCLCGQDSEAHMAGT